MGRLEGKTALITGATGGIGAATARAFLREGAQVMLVDLDGQRLQDTARRMEGGSRLATAAADVGDESALASAFQAAAGTFGGLDIVFANAGIEGQGGPVESFDQAEFRRVIDTNLIGVWLTMKHAVPMLKARGGGVILATASVAGLVGFPGLCPYVASKHAVCGLVKSAALELGEANIRVNAIAPGPIANAMMERVERTLSPGDPGAMRTGLMGALAIKRYGTNEEVAGLALYLASDEAGYLTGGIYTVDGGFTAA
ncbi:SDR family oxidoreductase [Marinicauda algicola]|uniref:SDR family oxidoreductase n=1 Tax=Marinicauda algicola TaxID=2029849 RepID=A0A4S2GX48_9PROT|nr:SDR family NAD(P)-dependent oxidoreductase [Marinicauda algicola]TGY87636.1 SDR family oxidoreductase [Marinicauda algicola]